MTRPDATPPPHTPLRLGRSALRVSIAIVAVVILAGAAYGGWYLFLRPGGPAPVNLAAVPTTSAGPSAAAATSGASAAPAGASARTTSTGTAGTLDGTWKVNTSIGSGASGSFVGYRVQEQLAGIGANTAVGRTSQVFGSFVLQGTSVRTATITADLTGLTSDDARRDGQLRQRGLQTATYPSATFVLAQPIDLGAIPAKGQVITVTATGQLTLHGQTRTVHISLQARHAGGVITIAGSLPITFADYGITPPTSFIALSVANHGTMELQLNFTHA